MPTSPLATTWMEVRRRGPRSLLRRAWRRYIYGEDRFVLFVGSHTGPAIDPGASPLTIRQAEAQDFSALRSLQPDQAARIPALVKRGDGWLHVARDGDRLVGYRFVTRRFAGRGILAGIVRLQPDQVYVDHIFVHDDYRRHRLAQLLSACQNQTLAALGFREYVAAIQADNVASIRLTLRRGARPVLFVDSRRRLFHHRCTVSPTMPPEVQRLVDEVRS